MAHRCRSCGRLSPSGADNYPMPDRLAPLAPHMAVLIEAAAEFERVSDDEADPGSPVDFIAWLDVDVQRAAGVLPRPRPMRGESGVRLR